MQISLLELRHVIREELIATRNDYQSALDDIQRRIRPVEETDVKMRYPEFYQAVTSGLHRTERMEELRQAKWFFIHTTFMKDVPHVMFPRGDVTIMYWDQGTMKVKACERDDVYDALQSFRSDVSAF